MMRKYLMGLTVGLLLPLAGQAQTADEIIAKNIQARGGMNKLKAIQTLRVTGKMTQGPGLEAPFSLELKRPNNGRMEFTFQGLTAAQAYDGKNGWQIMPFGGRKDPQPLSPEDLKAAEEQADMDGPLVDYKTKGHRVELVGKEKVEGTDAYKLKVTLKNGDVRYYYLDAEYFLDLKMEGKRNVRGTEREFESSFGDYKEVGGVMFPHSIESGMKGNPEREKMVIDKIEVNAPIDDSRFKMPEVKKEETPKPNN
ncbi:MAG: LolA family protein [Thermoanaerobaculia bacterium]